ncbi:MAG: DUF2520 domain-containing protein [Lewinella sp.]|nr:DUF2520 domain-containing protein [Lewinella sp.]
MWPRAIVLLGTGKVGSALARQLVAQGLPLQWLWNRSEPAVQALADDLQLNWTTDLSELPAEADLYILAVRDDALPPLAAALARQLDKGALVVHTSGATPSAVLGAHFPHFGVFYPLQTFSPGREPDFHQVPLCVHAANDTDLVCLEQLAQRLSERVAVVDDRQRAILHVAAVFTNNFTNYLQHISQAILTDAGLATDLLQPLLQETIAKLDVLSPEQAQTGPAIRGDQATIERHLAWLAQYPEWREIYRLLSEGIERM